MSLCASMLMLLLAAPTGLLAAHAGPPGETTAAAPGDRAERTARAARFFEGGRYVEAALEFEGLQRDFPAEPSFLFNAAASRDAAGHHAHAVAYVRQYLARPDLKPDDRKQGEEQLAESLRKVTAVNVSVALPPQGSRAVTVVAHHVARGPSDLRPDLEFPVRTASVTLELDPGAWIVRLVGPGYQPLEQQLTVSATPTAITLRPELVPVVGTNPPPARTVPPDAIRTTTRALYIAGGATAAVGLGLVGGGVGMIRGVQNCDGVLLDCRRRFARAFVVRNTGATLFGAGAGLAASALVWRSNDPRQRMIAWTSLAAVGGVGFILGEVLLVRGFIPFNRDNTDPAGALAQWNDHWTEHRHTVAPAFAATLRGLSVGLLAGAVTGLLVQRKHLGPGGAHKLRVEPSAGPGYTGLLLSGSF